ncbi:MAG: ABC transporter substrate-binding protein [Lachnospiraceae bacterium]
MKKNWKRNILFAGMLLLLSSGCGSRKGAEPPVSEAAGETAEQTEASKEEMLVQEESLKTKYPLTIQVYGPDGTVYEQTFEAAPKKVITNIPSATNILLELGLKENIYGILKPDNAPEEKWAGDYEELNQLADKKSISKEIIIGAEPDLVFGRAMTFTDEAAGGMGSIEALNEMEIPVYTLKASNFNIEQSLENIIEDVRNIGKIFDVQKAANEYADSLEERLTRVTEKVSQVKSDTRIKVMYMTAYQDGVFNAFGANSTLQECMLNLLNAENVLEKGENSLSLENLMVLNPDVIVYVKSDRNGATDAIAVDTLLQEETIAGVNAIANQKIIEIPYDALMDYGARTFDTMEELYEFFYEN